MKPRNLGWAIVIASLIVLILIISLKVQINQQLLQACDDMCSEEYGESCSMNNCPFREGNGISWLPDIISLLVAFLIGIGFYLIFSKKERVIDKKEYDLSGLSKEEKNVFNLLKNSKEEVYQSKIGQELELSKVKVTRILDKLEKRQLIERKRRGMTNVIILK